MTSVKDYLLELGLGTYQAKALDVLFKGESWTAKEISQEGKIPYTKTYEALQDLEEKGLVRYTMDTPRMYHTLEPESVFNMLLEKHKTHTKKLESTKNELVESLTLPASGVAQAFESNIWVLNPKAFPEDMRQMLFNARISFEGTAGRDIVTWLWTQPGIIDAIHTAIVKNKIEGRGLYDSSMKSSDFARMALSRGPLKSVQLIRKLSQIYHTENSEARQLIGGQIPAEVGFFDKKLVFMGTQDDKGTLLSIIKTTNRSFFQAMYSYFEVLWEKGEPIGNTWSNGLKKRLKK